MSDELSMTPAEQQLAEIVKRIMGAPRPSIFMPFARYELSLDWIIVLNKDVSTSMIPVPPTGLCLLQDNHPQPNQDQYVGFVFEGAKPFCETYQLFVSHHQVDLHRILDTLALRHSRMPQIFEARQTLRWLQNKRVLLP